MTRILTSTKSLTPLPAGFLAGCLVVICFIVCGCGQSTSPDTSPEQPKPADNSPDDGGSVSVGDGGNVPGDAAGTPVEARPEKPQEIPIPPEVPDSQDLAVVELEKIGAKVERNKNGDVQHVSLADLEIKDGHLKLLKPLTFLFTLDLTRTKVTDDGLQELASLNYLRELVLYETDVTGAGLVALEDLPRLRQVCLDFTKVSDETLPQVLRLKELTLLHLEEGKITDKGAKLLQQLRTLQTLKLTGTQVSEGAVAELEKKIPGLTIER